jgi:hypothetical protein
MKDEEVEKVRFQPFASYQDPNNSLHRKFLEDTLINEPNSKSCKMPEILASADPISAVRALDPINTHFIEHICSVVFPKKCDNWRKEREQEDLAELVEGAEADTKGC